MSRTPNLNTHLYLQVKASPGSDREETVKLAYRLLWGMPPELSGVEIPWSYDAVITVYRSGAAHLFNLKTAKLDYQWKTDGEKVEVVK